MARPDIQMTLYEALGVSEDATAAEIQLAWRRIAKAYHPDSRLPRDDGWLDPWPKRVFQIASAAFAVLGDPEKRAGYDEWLRATLDGRQVQTPPQKNNPPAPVGSAPTAFDALASIIDPDKLANHMVSGVRKLFRRRQ